MKKATLGFHMCKIWKILKRFSGTFHLAQTLKLGGVTTDYIKMALQKLNVQWVTLPLLSKRGTADTKYNIVVTTSTFFNVQVQWEYSCSSFSTEKWKLKVQICSYLVLYDVSAALWLITFLSFHTEENEYGAISFDTS